MRRLYSTGQWKRKAIAERQGEESTHTRNWFAWLMPLGLYFSGRIGKFIKLKDLELKAENNTQYLKNDSPILILL